MQIYLYQNEQQTGPYTEQQIRDLVAAGTIQTTDVCWYEGLSDWQPIDTVISFQPSVPPAAHHAAFTPQQAAPAVVQTNVKQGALIGGVACFVIGIILMFFSMWSFIIYGPLFLVAFILSIVAMSQRRVLGGILLLLATLVIPSILGLYLFTTRTSDALIAMTSESQAESVTQDSTPTSADSVPIVEEPSQITSPTSDAPEASAATPTPPPAKNSRLDERMGFRTFRLGTPLSDFNRDDLRPAEALIKTDSKIFLVKDFDPTLGAAEINVIQLNFNEDILESIMVRVKGEQNRIALRETLIAGYGEQDKTTSFMTDTLRWEGDDVVLTLNFELMGDAYARFSSKSVDTKIEDIKLQKARDAASTGADSL